MNRATCLGALTLVVFVACSSPPTSVAPHDDAGLAPTDAGGTAADASLLDAPPTETDATTAADAADAAAADAAAADAADAADAAVTPADASIVDAPDAGPPLLPDLIIDRDRASIDLAIEQRSFAADACELEPAENCVGAPGLRTLLRFAIESPNVGTADLALGPPITSNPNFVYSPCHNHFHYEGYAAYQLLDATGAEVATGQKQAFCLLDTNLYLTNDPTVSPNPGYYCGDQGISRGWSDVYVATLPCQWIDVTGVPDGDYTLRLSVNVSRTLPELDFTNNVTEVPVTLGDPALSSPTEPCPTGLDPRTTTGGYRECGWKLEGTWSCTPGATFRIGCAATCAGLGSCTGDPIMRVCDSARADGNCSRPAAMATSNNACGSVCPRAQNLTCPASGKVDVYSAARELGVAYTCNVAIEAQ